MSGETIGSWIATLFSVREAELASLLDAVWAGRKGDRVMPIGFWAVSRLTITEVLAYWRKQYHHPPPTALEVDRVVKYLKEHLNDSLKEIIIDFARGELE